MRVSSLSAGLLGSFFALLMRVEQSTLGVGLLYGDYHHYHTMLTCHGIVMIFAFIMPFSLGAVANYILPILLGVPDLLLPRINNVSHLLFLQSCIMLYLQLLLEDSVATG